MRVLISVIIVSIVLTSAYALSNNYITLVVYEKDSVEYVFFRLNRFRQLNFGENDIAWVLDEVRWNASLSLLVHGELWALSKTNSGLKEHLERIPRGSELMEVVAEQGEQCYAEWYYNGKAICENEK